MPRQRLTDTAAVDEYLHCIKRLLTLKGEVTERAVKIGVWVSLVVGFDRVLQLAQLVVLA